MWHVDQLTRNGTVYAEQMAITPVRDEGGTILNVVAANVGISEVTTMAELPRNGSERYQRRFENCPLALWEADYSALKTYLDDLKTSGITDFRKYFAEHPEAVKSCAAMIKVIDVNEAAIRMFDAANKEALIGALDSVFDASSYDDLKEQLVWLAEGNSSYKAEVANKSLNSETPDFALNLNIAPAFAACWSEVIISLEDISERIQREKRLARAMKMEAVGQLTGGIAHDFNNKLAIISGNLRLMIDKFGDELSEDMSEMMTDALSAADDGAQLTTRLLALSRKPAPDGNSIDINELITEFADFMRRTLGRSIDVDTRLADSLAGVQTDRSALDFAFLHLALNARDAMPEGGRLTLTTSNGNIESGVRGGVPITEPIPCVIVEVADTGCGMSADVLSRATERFFTTKDVDAGSGLGLSMVYDFVKECVGDLQFSSTPGTGTTVALYLPV